MRVLILFDKFDGLPRGGAADLVARNLIATQVNLGHAVSICTVSNPTTVGMNAVDALGAKWVPSESEVDSNNLRAKSSEFYLLRATASGVQRACIDKLIAMCLSEAARRGAFDVIVCCLLGTDAIALAARGIQIKIPSAKIVYWDHRSVYALPARNPFKRQIQKIRRRHLFRTAAVVAGVSPLHSQLIKRRLGIEGLEISTIPNVVDDRFFDQQISERSVVEIDSFTLETGYILGTQNYNRTLKGLSSLIETIPRVLKARPEVRFVLAGSYPPKLAQTLLAMKLSRHIVLLGRVSYEMMPRLVAGCSLAVVASHVETFSIPAAEALACGRPVATTACGGPESFVVDGVYGRVVQTRDPQKLADAIVSVWDNRSSYRPGDLKRHAARQFSSDAVLKAWAQIYARISVDAKSEH